MIMIFKSNIDKWLISLLCISFLFSATGCMSDSLNQDPDKIMEEELDKDNLWGTYLTTMQRNVISEVVNDFQRSDDLFGNMYSGYFSGTNNWEGGANGTTYSFPGHWIDTPFRIAFVDLMSPWNILRQKVDSTSVLFGVGEIVKVAGLHKATDIYGPLPYKNFGLKSPVPYDSQKDIYMSFFEELDHAIDILKGFDLVNPNSKALEEYDLIYNSNIPLWIRFANSLKLRLAMRIRFVEPQLAKEIAEKAVGDAYGVLSLNNDNAMIADNTNLAYTFSNPMFNIWSGYDDDVMGATMDTYLNGYEDPRRSFYFQENSKGEYRGLRNGYKDGHLFKKNKELSKPNIFRSTPYPWMTASEVYFLRAEGAVLGWDMKGTPESLYNEGITKSFERCNLDVALAQKYLNNDSSTPIDYPGVMGKGKVSAQSSIKIKWNEKAQPEEKLERIITQKWIAIFPLGQEAWSEYRRTGYPKIYPIIDNLSNGVISSEAQVRRLPFPESEYLGNKEEVLKGAELLQGADNGSTKLWWDVK